MGAGDSGSKVCRQGGKLKEASGGPPGAAVGVNNDDSSCKGEAWESEDVVQPAGLGIDDGDPGIWGLACEAASAVRKGGGGVV